MISQVISKFPFYTGKRLNLFFLIDEPVSVPVLTVELS